MKLIVTLTLLIFSIFIYGQAEKDSIQYTLKLNKSIYSINDTIELTLIVKNKTEHDINLWIETNNSLVGKELKLINSNHESMINQYWVSSSSWIYDLDEIEEMKTKISPYSEFKKEIRLRQIVELKSSFGKGVYQLSYLNSKPLKFEVK